MSLKIPLFARRRTHARYFIGYRRPGEGYVTIVFEAFCPALRFWWRLKRHGMFGKIQFWRG